MEGLQASISPQTCPTISYELLKILSSKTLNSLASFKLVISASCSASLLEAEKVKQRAYPTISPVRLVRITPVPLAEEVDDPST